MTQYDNRLYALGESSILYVHLFLLAYAGKNTAFSHFFYYDRERLQIFTVLAKKDHNLLTVMFKYLSL